MTTETHPSPWVVANRVGDFLPVPDPTAGWQFCKTNWSPYDRIVCAVLAAARDRSTAILVTSDGKAPDWAPGLAWASAVLQRPIGWPVVSTS
jgi:hypothetical protein